MQVSKSILASMLATCLHAKIQRVKIAFYFRMKYAWKFYFTSLSNLRAATGPYWIECHPPEAGT
jgi:hypothetical protein